MDPQAKRRAWIALAMGCVLVCATGVDAQLRQPANPLRESASRPPARTGGATAGLVGGAATRQEPLDSFREPAAAPLPEADSALATSRAASPPVVPSSPPAEPAGELAQPGMFRLLGGGELQPVRPVQHQTRGPFAGGDSMVYEGAVVHEGEAVGGFPGGFPGGLDTGCTDCASPLLGCDSCGGQGCGDCLIPCPVFSFKNLELWGGVHGATGPVNRTGDGSFGFQEGLNWGTRLPCSMHGLGLQAGFMAVQSNLSGASFTTDSRDQFFVTLGIFRRVDWGLQGGLAIDYLSERWYLRTDLSQLRGELSWMFPAYHELGFRFATNTQGSSSTSTLRTAAGTQQVAESWQGTDYFAFFYRRRLNERGASCQAFAGFSSTNDGILGADIRLPLTERLAMHSEFTYLSPSESSVTTGFSEESWNVAVSLVWYPGWRTATGHDYYRPLFNVANNGSFLVDRN